MKFRAFVLLVLLTVAASAIADVIRVGSLSAEPRLNGVHLQWYSDDETGVAFYVVERMLVGSSSYVVIMAHYTAKGNGSFYPFDDETAFKTMGNYYRYRITAMDASGNAVGGASYYTGVLSSVPVGRRTWGSIKAMFR